MIFATVGTHNKGFDRLVEMVDCYAKSTDEHILIQVGSSTYTPKFADSFSFETQDVIEKYYQQARIIITHAGAGSIISSIKFLRPLIVVPRLKKYGEAIDNHQLQLAKLIKNRGLGEIVYTFPELCAALKLNNNTYTIANSLNSLSLFLKEHLKNLEVSIS